MRNEGEIVGNSKVDKFEKLRGAARTWKLEEGNFGNTLHAGKAEKEVAERVWTTSLSGVLDCDGEC